MKRCLVGFVVLVMMAMPMVAVADAGFEDACGLLAQATAVFDGVYERFSGALDTVDAVGKGELTVAQGIEQVQAASAALREMPKVTLAPSDALRAFLLERGYSFEDFQAVADGAVLTADSYADNLDSYLQMWQAYPDTAKLDTALMRLGLAYEKRLDFVGINTVLLPQTDEEADAIQRLVVETTPFMLETKLPWERELELCMAKYDALEANYAELLTNTQADLAQLEQALDAFGVK